MHHNIHYSHDHCSPQKTQKKRFKFWGEAAGFSFEGLGGAVLGGLLGAGVAKLAPSDQIQRARAEIARRKAEISSTKKKNITATQQTTATIQEQIVKLESNITENQES